MLARMLVGRMEGFQIWTSGWNFAIGIDSMMNLITLSLVVIYQTRMVRFDSCEGIGCLYCLAVMERHTSNYKIDLGRV